MIKMQGTHPPSSFWILDKGLAPPGVMLDVAPMVGLLGSSRPLAMASRCVRKSMVMLPQLFVLQTQG
jgi:hypothetical protein